MPFAISAAPATSPRRSTSRSATRPTISAPKPSSTADSSARSTTSRSRPAPTPPGSSGRFLATAPRLEILYHSIHYLDLVRSWFGDPEGVYCKTVVNPQTPSLAPTKSTIILDYGPSRRVFIATSHGHDFGDRYQQSFAQWEGTRGAARITLGLNLDYPHGKPDTLEFAQRGDPARRWHTVPVLGENFPDAFIGTMGALQAFAEGSAPTLPSHFEDAFRTMALVEACYTSSQRPAEPIPLE